MSSTLWSEYRDWQLTRDEATQATARSYFTGQILTLADYSQVNNTVVAESIREAMAYADKEHGTRESEFQKAAMAADFERWDREGAKCK